MDRPGGAESEALDSDAPLETEYYDLSHEFDVKMLHPARDDQLQVFSARFNEVFGKCQGLGNVCFLHGILTQNGRLCVAMRFSEGSIGDRMARLKGGGLPLSDVLRNSSWKERRHGLHDIILNGLEIAGIIDRRYMLILDFLTWHLLTFVKDT